MKLLESAKNYRFSWKNFLWIGGVHVLAVTMAFYFFTWQAFALFWIMSYLVGMVGITFGFHRLLTHKGFKAAKWVENFAALCGTWACQGGPIAWVGQHRVHHAFSDTPNDPHNIHQGFWHSHIGFILNRREDLDKLDQVAQYCPDIAKDKFFLFLDNNMIKIQIALGLFLFALGGVLGNAGGAHWAFDFYNAVAFVVWGIFVRLVYVYHITWFVNSATHSWGKKIHDSRDESKNNWWVGILAFGEGWHNNHHFEPRAARHGWKWYQIDFTWYLIRLLRKLGLVKDVKVPKGHPLIG